MNELEKFLENRVKEDHGKYMLHLKHEEIEKFMLLIAGDDMLSIKIEISAYRVHFELKQVINAIEDNMWFNSELLKVCDSEERRKRYIEIITKCETSKSLFESICNKEV